LPSSIDAIKFQSLPILDHEGKRVVKQLKKHDLDLFRQHIEGINQDQGLGGKYYSNKNNIQN
jgi:hypothetical protein